MDIAFGPRTGSTSTSWWPAAAWDVGSSENWSQMVLFGGRRGQMVNGLICGKKRGTSVESMESMESIFLNTFLPKSRRVPVKFSLKSRERSCHQPVMLGRIGRQVGATPLLTWFSMGTLAIPMRWNRSVKATWMQRALGCLMLVWFSSLKMHDFKISGNWPWNTGDQAIFGKPKWSQPLPTRKMCCTWRARHSSSSSLLLDRWRVALRSMSILSLYQGISRHTKIKDNLPPLMLL